jgi:hypothetical protein
MKNLVEDDRMVVLSTEETIPALLVSVMGSLRKMEICSIYPYQR